MKETIRQLLKGNVRYELPELLFSREKIAVTLKAGSTVQDEIYFGASDESALRGTVSSTNRRLVPGFFSFEGGMIRLPYGVDAVGLEPGAVQEGWLTVTSNVGEYRIPFEIRTEKGAVSRSSGQVLTLEAFGSLAEKDFREAFRLFTSPDFLSVTADCEPRIRALAQSFSTQPVTWQHLEEFLIACGLKKKVEIEVQEKLSCFYELDVSRRESFTVIRSGWGHLRMEVSCVGSFLETEQKVVTDENFIGSRYTLYYVIHRSAMHEGMNRGQILIRTPYETLTLQIQASTTGEADLSLSLMEGKHRLSLQRDLLEYRMGKIPFDEWAVGTRYSLDRLKELGFFTPEYQLLEAWLLLSQDRTQEAGEILDGFIRKDYSAEEAELAGTVLYLSCLAGLIEDRERAITRLSRMYMMKGDSCLLLLYLLELDPEIRTASEAVYRMEELYSRGCCSPFLYLEAWKKLQAEPELLHNLSPFWVQVFAFASRRGLMTAELSMRFAYLSGYEKEFHPLIARILERCCEAFPDDDTLEALCRYLIIGNPRRSGYFRWFSMAVDRGLRLTRLYEYYVETMGMGAGAVLPEPLLLYFRYNHDTLGDAKKAFLYANIIQNKAKDPENYERYLNHMKEFSVRKLARGSINENYAVLYREFLTHPHHSHDAAAIARVMQTCRLYSDNEQIRQVIVRHEELIREEIYPIVKGEAFPRIYSDSGVILFQDEKQRRFAVTVKYSLTSLLEDPGLVDRVIALGVDEPGVLLNYLIHHEVNRYNLEVFRRGTEYELFTPAFRSRLRSRLLDFFTENVHGEDLDSYLLRIDASLYSAQDRARLIRTLIARGMDIKAMAVIESQGAELIPVKELMKLVSRIITIRDFAEDEELLALSRQVFREGFYDEPILLYLIRYIQGPVSELFSIRTSALGFEMDTYEVDEKLLCLLMLTGDDRKDGEEVLASYIRNRGRDDVIQAYLTRIAYGVFVRDYTMSPFVLDCLYRAWEEKTELPFVCRLALFKEVSRGKAKGVRTADVEKDILEECVRKNLGFAFFRRLPESLLAGYGLDDKVFVELHENPEAQVTLCYSQDSGLSKPPAWRSVPLESAYPGIFNRCFTLFYGETIRYVFQVEKDGKKMKTSERVLTMNRVENASVSRYQRINQMLSARKLGRDQEVREKMKACLRQEQYAAELFHLR